MSDALLIDNLLTFFLAGHDTTAKALTWTLYCWLKGAKLVSGSSYQRAA